MSGGQKRGERDNKAVIDGGGVPSCKLNLP